MSPGDSISKYRILGPLGRGGMGVVYRAEDTKLQRQVALKFLPGDSIGELEKQRFLNEARAAAAARHPNICPIYDIEESDGILFIAMALLEGQTLQKKIATGQVGVAEALAIGIQIGNGLECAHGLGIIHRDIKSSNIMVDPTGHASIMDFGLALRPDEARLTVEGGSVGTPSYMSPEQVRGLPLDGRADVWSLGVVMFEMLTGVLPFRRDKSATVMHAILFDPAPPVSSLRSNVQPELSDTIARALAKEPEKRWQSAGELVAELRKFQGSSLDETRTMTMMPVTRPRVRGRFWMGVVAIGSVAILAGVFGYRRFERPPPDRQIAVLPFRVVGNDDKARTVSDGLMEILTGALSDVGQARKILVVPSSEIQRRGISSAEDARRMYRVDLAITGSALPVADRSGKVQFTLNLVDAAALRQKGSQQQFVWDPANPISSRDDAVASEMKLLNIDVTPAVQTSIRVGDTDTPTAYSLYLQGRGLLGRYDVSGNLDQAIASFEGAVKEDPRYALAWAGLAEATLRKARMTGDRNLSLMALENAQHAVQLDDSLAIVHSVLGQVYSTAGREEEAVAEFKKAIRIAPANAEAPRELARVYSNLGRFQEAEASYRQAIKSRPTDWYAHLLLGLFYYERERYGEAEAELKAAQQLTPDNDLISRNLGSILTMQGRYAEAIGQFQYSLSIRSNANTYAALGFAYFYLHRYQEAVQAAEAAIDLDSNNYVFWGNVGIYDKWIKGGTQKSELSLRHALELGLKYRETSPMNYDLRANLAEYRARLGDVRGALAEADGIPPSARKPLASRLALVYELIGKRSDAIQLINDNLSTRASLNQIRDDPDLAQLWNSPAMQQLASTRH